MARMCVLVSAMQACVSPAFDHDVVSAGDDENALPLLTEIQKLCERKPISVRYYSHQGRCRAMYEYRFGPKECPSVMANPKLLDQLLRDAVNEAQSDGLEIADALQAALGDLVFRPEALVYPLDFHPDEGIGTLTVMVHREVTTFGRKRVNILVGAPVDAADPNVCKKPNRRSKVQSVGSLESTTFFLWFHKSFFTPLVALCAGS